MNINLTTGNIGRKLYRFILPLLATSFINITYGFVDMICIGRLGSGAVAAVGTCGFFLWFANASASMAKIGTQVYVSQEYGNKNFDNAKKYYQSSFLTNFIFGLLICLIFFVFNSQIISFFNLGDKQIINYAIVYFKVIAFSMPFMYANHVLSAFFNSIGNSRLTFLTNSFGLVFNIVFDILLIFGIGFFPRLEVFGAALATALAHVCVFTLLIFFNLNQDKTLRLSFGRFDFEKAKSVCKVGFPSAIQSTLYCIYSMILARIISYFGPVEIAVQKIGGQIESISWMTADGLAMAATTFVGQNFGAKNYDRIKKGTKILSKYCLTLGLISTLVLFLFSRQIFMIFIDEPMTINSGSTYLKILSISQIFMCFETLFIGIFSGYGQTKTPAIISIILTGLRIPMALMLTHTPLGVNGVWVALSMTSIFKGILLPTVFYLYHKKDLSHD